MYIPKHKITVSKLCLIIANDRLANALGTLNKHELNMLHRNLLAKFGVPSFFVVTKIVKFKQLDRQNWIISQRFW